MTVAVVDVNWSRSEVAAATADRREERTHYPSIHGDDDPFVEISRA